MGVDCPADRCCRCRGPARRGTARHDRLAATCPAPTSRCASRLSSAVDSLPPIAVQELYGGEGGRGMALATRAYGRSEGVSTGRGGVRRAVACRGGQRGRGSQAGGEALGHRTRRRPSLFHGTWSPRRFGFSPSITNSRTAGYRSPQTRGRGRRSAQAIWESNSGATTHATAITSRGTVGSSGDLLPRRMVHGVATDPT